MINNPAKRRYVLLNIVNNEYVAREVTPQHDWYTTDLAEAKRFTFEAAMRERLPEERIVDVDDAQAVTTPTN